MRHTAGPHKGTWNSLGNSLICTYIKHAKLTPLLLLLSLCFKIRRRKGFDVNAQSGSMVTSICTYHPRSPGQFLQIYSLVLRRFAGNLQLGCYPNISKTSFCSANGLYFEINADFPVSSQKWLDGVLDKRIPDTIGTCRNPETKCDAMPEPLRH